MSSKRIENCHRDHISFNLKGNKKSISLSVSRAYLDTLARKYASHPGQPSFQCGFFFFVAFFPLQLNVSIWRAETCIKIIDQRRIRSRAIRWGDNGLQRRTCVHDDTYMFSGKAYISVHIHFLYVHLRTYSVERRISEYICIFET